MATNETELKPLDLENAGGEQEQEDLKRAAQTDKVVRGVNGSLAPAARKLIQRLLFGAGIDRNAKARARVGLAIVAFALIYAVIAARLVMLAASPDGQSARRSGPSGNTDSASIALAA